MRTRFTGQAVTRQRRGQSGVSDAFAVPDVPDIAAMTPETTMEPAGDTSPANGEPTETVSGHSRDRCVDVEVDLRGRLCDLRIDSRALRGPHPQRVGSSVVEAMSDARTRAVRLTIERRRR